MYRTEYEANAATFQCARAHAVRADRRNTIDAIYCAVTLGAVVVAIGAAVALVWSVARVVLV